MVALPLTNSLAGSSLRNWNRIEQIFCGIFPWPKPEAKGAVHNTFLLWQHGRLAMGGAYIVKTKVFVAFAMCLWSSLVSESKKRPAAARFRRWCKNNVVYISRYRRGMHKVR